MLVFQCVSFTLILLPLVRRANIAQYWGIDKLLDVVYSKHIEQPPTTKETTTMATYNELHGKYLSLSCKFDALYYDAEDTSEVSTKLDAVIQEIKNHPEHDQFISELKADGNAVGLRMWSK
jgi:hypothetical protein